MVRRASEEESKHAQAVTPHRSHTENTVQFVGMALEIFRNHGVKSVGASDSEVVITTLNDITLAVYENKTSPGLDAEITDAMHSSGFLDHIDMDKRQNPYRYDDILFRLRIECDANGDEYKLFETLRQEINKDADVFESRLTSYINGKENIKSGLKYAEAEFSIAKGLMQGIKERVVIIGKYSAKKRNTQGFREINDMCINILKYIEMYSPELLIP